MTEQNNMSNVEDHNQRTEDNTYEQSYDKEDVEKNKTMAGLAYLLFFLPLIICPDSAFGRFHANQGLILTIVAVVGNMILSAIFLIGWILLPVFNIFMLVLLVMGLMNGLNGKAKKLPVIGKFTIIK